MKKLLLGCMVGLLVSFFGASGALAKNAGDEMGIKYNNVFARFIPAQGNAQGFWFYVYKKGEMWPVGADAKAAYSHFPTYIAVRAYKENQEGKIRAKFFEVFESGISVISPDNKIFNPFYFTANSEEWSAVINYNYKDAKTVILSGFLSGKELSRFEAGVLPQTSCGKDTDDFREMLSAFPRI